MTTWQLVLTLLAEILATLRVRRMALMEAQRKFYDRLGEVILHALASMAQQNAPVTEHRPPAVVSTPAVGTRPPPRRRDQGFSAEVMGNSVADLQETLALVLGGNPFEVQSECRAGHVRVTIYMCQGAQTIENNSDLAAEVLDMMPNKGCAGWLVKFSVVGPMKCIVEPL